MEKYKIYLSIFLFALFFSCQVFPQNTTKNIEIILDASDSMNDTINGDKKIDLAKTTILKIVSEILPESAPKFKIGLRTFGEGREIDFKKDSRLLIPIKQIDIKEFENALKEITPKGYSPIAYSLLLAGYDFPISGDNTIVLITDGQENCGGNIISTVHRLKTEGLSIIVNVIGYGIKDKKIEKEFKEITRISSGTYYSAEDVKSLEINFKTIFGNTYFKNTTVKRMEVKEDEWTHKEPWIATKYSLIFPGLGHFYTDRPIKGVLNFIAEWIMLGFDYGVTKTKEYKTHPIASFTKDSLDFSCLNFYISNAAGVYLYTHNRNNKEHYKLKSPSGAFIRSVILPGWGDIYIGDSPETGLSYMFWTGFFYYKLLNPIPNGVHAERVDIREIRQNSRGILRIIYGLQMIVFISADLHNYDVEVYKKLSGGLKDTEWNFGFLNTPNITPMVSFAKKF
ncbi:MAG: hypothetical protein A2539_04060 [Elusimicrobia bacterium RIFOXYD2_FULL_34_15]|nr:MAG: hypothetical protein A2539_04060 [Elusimicrobia bacterium RIFOXYD2_FULL_34_15]